MALPLREIIAEAVQAPSVHNTQPVRWQINDDRLVMIWDRDKRLPCGDPTNHDAMISAGAALEGVAIAASRHGLKAAFEPMPFTDETARFQTLGTIGFQTGASPEPLLDYVQKRSSWRGAFGPLTSEDRSLAAGLGSDACFVFNDAGDLSRIAKWADMASMRFMRRDDFRRELVSWMRLTRGHPRWSLDGLNADAMQLGRWEAAGASIVLGPAFRALNAIGLAGPLLSEAARFSKAAGLMVLHRPADESAIDSGRQFYRAWLEIERAGFVAQVIAALADDPQACGQLHAAAGLGGDRRVLTAFVFGRLPDTADRPNRARLPLQTLIIDEPQ